MRADRSSQEAKRDVLPSADVPVSDIWLGASPLRLVRASGGLPIASDVELESRTGKWMSSSWLRPAADLAWSFSAQDTSGDSSLAEDEVVVDDGPSQSL